MRRTFCVGQAKIKSPFSLPRLAGLTLVYLLFCQSPASLAQTPSTKEAQPVQAEASDFNQAIVRVDTKVVKDAPSVATLGPRRIGSGVIIGESLVLTIGYVLLEADEVTVTSAGGKAIPASVAGYDHATGFGLIKTLVPLEGKALKLGDSDSVQVEQRLLTQGHGEGGATELVVVSRRTFSGGWEYMIEKPIYTFPAVNNWSGSALMSQDGQLLGIGSLVVNDAADALKGVPGNLFVPVNLLKPILSDLLSKGRRSNNIQPWLGMTTESVQDRLVVVRVSKESPADRAGVEAGDVVVSVGPDNITGQADFYRRVWNLGPAGTAVKLRLASPKGEKEVEIQSIDRFEFLKKPQGV